MQPKTQEEALKELAQGLGQGIGEEIYKAYKTGSVPVSVLLQFIRDMAKGMYGFYQSASQLPSGYAIGTSTAKGIQEWAKTSPSAGQVLSQFIKDIGTGISGATKHAMSVFDFKKQSDVSKSVSPQAQTRNQSVGEIKKISKKGVKTSKSQEVTPEDEAYVQQKIEELKAKHPELASKLWGEKGQEEIQETATGDIQRQLEDLDKQYQEIKEGYHKVYEEIIKNLKESQIPEYPELKGIPEPPQRGKINTFQNLSEIGKFFTSMAILAVSAMGIKHNIPEAGMYAYTEMLKAFKENDDEKFAQALKDWELQVMKISDENVKLLDKYKNDLLKYQDDKEKMLQIAGIAEKQLKATEAYLQIKTNLIATLAQLKSEEAKQAVERLKLQIEYIKAMAQLIKAYNEEAYKNALLGIKRKELQLKEEKLKSSNKQEKKEEDWSALLEKIKTSSSFSLGDILKHTTEKQAPPQKGK